MRYNNDSVTVDAFCR